MQYNEENGKTSEIGSMSSVDVIYAEEQKCHGQSSVSALYFCIGSLWCSCRPDLLFFVCVCKPKLEEIGFPLVLRKSSQNLRWEDQVQMLVEFRISALYVDWFALRHYSQHFFLFFMPRPSQ